MVSDPITFSLLYGVLYECYMGSDTINEETRGSSLLYMGLYMGSDTINMLSYGLFLFHTWKKTYGVRHD
jgi:hypothetical protein